MEKIKIINEKSGGSGGVIYGMGLIGSLFYFFQQSVTLQDWIIGIIKSLLWPAFLVYSSLQFLNV